MTELEKIKYLCSMILLAVKNQDKDSLRSHLEDLNGFLIENKLIAE